MSEPRGGAAILYKRRGGPDDRVEAAKAVRSEKTDSGTLIRIVDCVHRLISVYGAQETLRLLTTLLREAGEIGREPFAAARTTYGSSFPAPEPPTSSPGTRVSLGVFPTL